jgi:hypothetical protein
MLKIEKGAKVCFEKDYIEMYYSHINEPCWKVVTNNSKFAKYGFIKEDGFFIKTFELYMVHCQSAYFVDTYGNYKGYKCQILGITNNIVSLNPSVEYQAMSKDYAKHGYDPQLEVDINEVEEIWEERTPIEGFKFDTQPIVYLKRTDE